jgi:hypothetical protein
MFLLSLYHDVIVTIRAYCKRYFGWDFLQLPCLLVLVLALLFGCIIPVACRDDGVWGSTGLVVTLDFQLSRHDHSPRIILSSLIAFIPLPQPHTPHTIINMARGKKATVWNTQGRGQQGGNRRTKEGFL